jgi:hypothetical protein
VPQALRPVRKRVLVAVALETFSRISYSDRLFQPLVKIMKMRTRRIGAFWVGPGAEEKLLLSWHLGISVSSPQQYDLALKR